MRLSVSPLNSLNGELGSSKSSAIGLEHGLDTDSGIRIASGPCLTAGKLKTIHSGCGRSVFLKQNGTVPELAQMIARIAKRAVVHRKAATADTTVELIAQLGEAANPFSQHVPPDRGELHPVFCCERAPGGKPVQRVLDSRQRDTCALRDLDNGNTAQSVPGITTLVARTPLPLNQAFGLIEMHSCDGDAASAGQLSNRQWHVYIDHEWLRSLDLIYT